MSILKEAIKSYYYYIHKTEISSSRSSLGPVEAGLIVARPSLREVLTLEKSVGCIFINSSYRYVFIILYLKSES